MTGKVKSIGRLTPIGHKKILAEIYSARLEIESIPDIARKA